MSRPWTLVRMREWYSTCQNHTGYINTLRGKYTERLLLNLVEHIPLSVKGLTNYREQNQSCETDSRSASQEISLPWL